MPFETSQSGPPELSTLPKPGYYVWQIVAVEDGPTTDNGATIRWTLSPLDPKKPGGAYLLDKGQLPYEIKILTSNKVGVGSRAGAITAAVFGVPLDLIDIDRLMESLPNGQFGAVMSINQKGWPTVGEPVETDPIAFPAADAGRLED